MHLSSPMIDSRRGAVATAADLRLAILLLSCP